VAPETRCEQPFQVCTRRHLGAGNTTAEEHVVAHSWWGQREIVVHQAAEVPNLSDVAATVEVFEAVVLARCTARRD
jgi:hypothetical protein